MSLPADVIALTGAVRSAQPLADGCISRTHRLHTADGRTLVLKQRDDAPLGLYAGEAEGLEALRLSLRTPTVLGHGRTWLLLEDAGPQVAWHQAAMPETDSAWETYGRALAHLHGRLSSRCGWHHDTWWGLMRMDQRWQSDGARFYREQRFGWFLQRPQVVAWVPVVDRAGVQRIADRLDQLVPSQPACLNHGDLWAGNRARFATGTPVLGAIDPFIHYGWAECDLHNCLMFGGFPPRFFDAYRESHPLEPGWRQRSEIFYLLHLLGMIDQDIERAYSLDWLHRIVQQWA